MIEFIDETACLSCGKCAEVCPGDVLDFQPGRIPSIARQDDCQSCRQCSLHCSEDAIYVSLLGEPLANPDKEAIIAAGRPGKYAAWLGWKKGQSPDGDRSGTEYGFLAALREARGTRGAPDPADRVRRQLWEAKERNYI
jgi:NAD-dependent dihydropyrimidine dehydrogenase PreA subunit